MDRRRQPPRPRSASAFGLTAHARPTPAHRREQARGIRHRRLEPAPARRPAVRSPSNTKVFVDFGPTPGLGATVEAEIRNLLTQIPDSSGGVLAAEQFYAHAPLHGLPGRAPVFYRWRTQDGFTSDTTPAWTAMPSLRTESAPFRFTMMGDQAPTPLPRCHPGCRGAYVTTATTSLITTQRSPTPTTC